MNFSKEELIQMIYALGEADRNCLLGSRIYKQRFNELRQPSVKAFEKLKARFEATGNVAYPKPNKEPYKIGENEKLNVLLAIEENPEVSCRELEARLDISKSSVNRTIKIHKYHPYHMSLHQELHGDDFYRRVNFCQTILNRNVADPYFLPLILCSDEATFKSDGQVNRHNMHYYATENPHWVRQINYQRQWSLNVWGGVLNNKVIGPFFFDGPLNGRMYLNFLEEHLPVLLQDVDLQTRNDLWYQHDGAAPHYARIVRTYLNNWRDQQWIGRGGPIAWPPRSPDLTPLDFFLWGYVKGIVYRTVPTTKEDMKNRIRNAFANVTEPMLRNVRETFLRRLNLCIQENGNIFEHLV